MDPSRGTPPAAPQRSDHDSTPAVLAAFGANLGIAVAKFVGFLFTGAASLLAEAVHSVADTSNQGLLLLGARRARRRPNVEHPFGFGRERYFWAFVVAVVLFTGGGLFALVEGEEKLRRPHTLESPLWAVGILLVAIVLEGFSLRTAVRRSRSTRNGRGWWSFIRRSKEPELPVVVLEDSGALLGLGFALAGVTLAHLTGNPRWDALGSIAIGVLLVTIALLLAREMKSLLIGESAAPEVVEAIRDGLGSIEGVEQVLDLRTGHLSPDEVLVVARVVVDPGARSVEEVLAHAEAAIRSQAPSVCLVYLQPEGRTSQATSSGTAPSRGSGGTA